ncbi:MAG TPA: manganese efflux pump [Candidatus Binataceae bacterium]|nr:manganese efflux pump [Candidatus Binataceae bacterium]
MAKVLAVAFAVGLDVLAISVGVGVLRLAWAASFRVGLTFAFAEVFMQFLGYQIGAGAGLVLGHIASYAGFALLAIIGALMIRASYRSEAGAFDPTRGSGLALAALSISMDSLGVGVALPAAGIPVVPLLVVVTISTTCFTLVGLEFGARLGERYEHGAERTAGVILIVLAALFMIENLMHPSGPF